MDEWSVTEIGGRGSEAAGEKIRLRWTGIYDDDVP
jgi:hypothetical protein